VGPGDYFPRWCGDSVKMCLIKLSNGNVSYDADNNGDNDRSRGT
jgi:hypothetical protein